MFSILKRKKVTNRELKEIRRALETLNSSFDMEDYIDVAIALPEPCSPGTRRYAEELIERLKAVKVAGRVCFVLSFAISARSDKPYEVMRNLQLGSRVIRVYGR